MDGHPTPGCPMPESSSPVRQSAGFRITRGVEAVVLVGLPPPRIVIGEPPRLSTAPNLSRPFYAAATPPAGRRAMPAGGSPVMANRHKLISSFLASATI